MLLLVLGLPFASGCQNAQSSDHLSYASIARQLNCDRVEVEDDTADRTCVQGGRDLFISHPVASVNSRDSARRAFGKPYACSDRSFSWCIYGEDIDAQAKRLGWRVQP